MLLGMSRETAARFSFLLSLPAITAAGLYSLWDDAIQPWIKNEQSIIQTPGMVTNLVIATLVSAIVGYAAIVLMLRYLRTHTMAVFYHLSCGDCSVAIVFLLVCLERSAHVLFDTIILMGTLLIMLLSRRFPRTR